MRSRITPNTDTFYAVTRAYELYKIYFFYSFIAYLLLIHSLLFYSFIAFIYSVNATKKSQKAGKRKTKHFSSQNNLRVIPRAILLKNLEELISGLRIYKYILYNTCDNTIISHTTLLSKYDSTERLQIFFKSYV